MFETMVNISQEDFEKIMTTSIKKTYKPSKRDEKKKVYFDSHYLYLLEQILDDIKLIADCDKDSVKNRDNEGIKDLMINLRQICKELDEINDKPIKYGHPLKMSNYKRHLFEIKRLLKEIKEKGGCPWYVNEYFEKYKMYFKAFKKPVKCR